MRAYERFLQYVEFFTASDPDRSETPTSDRQFALARRLRDELLSLGLEAELDEYAYVYGMLPATPGNEGLPTVGFVAHIDTAPDFPAEHVRPLLHPDYDGKDLPLGNSGRVLTANDFPHLRELVGETLITTDGTTLLGADDKAGIAEILTALETVVRENIPHGRIAVCFTPDEEVGAGTAHFDIPRFGADFAYTVDGSTEGEVICENFNAAAATVTVNGKNVHPGDAKDVMINASLVAAEWNAQLPPDEIPARTEGYEGFYHLTDFSGTVERAVLSYILRDHNPVLFERKKDTCRRITDALNQKYGAGTVELSLRDQYRNMREKLLPDFAFVADLAIEATRRSGLTPITDRPIRGGTDGANLTWLGLPTPNLGTGGYAFHGPFEHITVEAMDRVTRVLVEIIRLIHLKKTLM
jgi:tripeptide aminopeptidase